MNGGGECNAHEHAGGVGFNWLIEKFTDIGESLDGR